MVHETNAPKSLSTGDCIVRWQLSDETSAHFPGVARPMPDTVDYRFVNGWIDTGDLPCRQAWREATTASLGLHGTTFGITAQATPAPPRCERLYLGGEDDRVDLSSFRFEPTLVMHWARVCLFVANDADAAFTFDTAGTLDAWLDGQHRLAFAPCTRNRPASIRLELLLSAGRHELLLRVADLHERDTTYGFRCRLVEGDGVFAGLDTAVDEGRLADVVRAMNALRTERLIHERDPIRIVCDAPPAEAISIRVTVDGAWSGSQTMRVPGDAASAPLHITLSNETPLATLFDVPPLHAGCLMLRFAVRLGDVTIERSLGTTLLPPPLAMSSDDTLAVRKRTALEQLVRLGSDGPSRALVLLAAGRDSTHEETRAQLHACLRVIDARHDCADFQLMPLLWIRLRYADRLVAADARRLDEALLGFRYWLDEPGNDVMWFWSENHVLCFQVARYLAGTLFADRGFANSGLSGEAHRNAAAHALARWFDAIDAHGLGEWNSAAYYPIDLVGLLTLAEFAPDVTLGARATALCDRIFTMTALHTLGGVPSGSQGRSYDKELLSGPANELGSVAAVAFGGPWYPGHDRASVLFALSRYAPPGGLAKLARLAAGETRERHYTQGLDSLGKLMLWKSRHAQLSAVVGHGSGQAGHQQHVLDVRLIGHPMARLWINHPGELKVWGDGRPSYWAGNGLLPRLAVRGRHALLIQDLGDAPGTALFTHAFVPREALDEVRHERCDDGSTWLFARSGEGYAGLCATSGCEAHTDGLFAGSEWRQQGRFQSWLVVVGDRDLDGDFASFAERCHGLSPHRVGHHRLAYQDEAAGIELDIDGSMSEDGVPVEPPVWRVDGYLDTSARFELPQTDRLALLEDDHVTDD